MTNTAAILHPDCMYHIYNRANGNENLFLSDENYRFFLTKYYQYILPIVDVFCYCLMPNHFHFLIRIKNEHQILKHLNATENENYLEIPTNYISKQFSKLFSSYTQAFNKQQLRKGSLFMKNFKRIRVDEPKYLVKLIHYIHYNPLEANICSSLSNWTYSSYNSILSQKKTSVCRNEVIELFDDIDNFVYCHQHPPQITGIEFR